MCVFRDDQLIPMIPGERPEAVVASLGAPRDYNHDLVNLPAMWKHTKGAGVRVAVLDTGMPRHRDISVTGSRSFIAGYLEDRNGHSTGVGAIIAGKCPPGFMGITGIAPECEDYYGAVLNESGAGSLGSVAAGILWAVEEIGADVINLSLGTPNAYGCDQKIADACRYAYEKGVTVVAAAGNDASDVNWPAALETVIAVAAVDKNLKTASFSARGPEVEFAAGGVNVMTAYLDNGYASMSGTSFSAPVISGMAALIISEYRSRGVKLAPDEVRNCLKDISYDIGDPGRDDCTGWGIPVFTKDTSSGTGKPGKPKRGTWFERLLGKLKWW